MFGKSGTNKGKVGIFSHGYKHGKTLIVIYCLDCNKKLSKCACYYNVIRCKSCSKKFQHKEGKYSLRIKKIYYCIDCGNKVSQKRNKRCHSCEMKRRHSKGIINNKGKNCYFFGKITHGKWSKYNNIWMRSSWEVAYAKYLDKNGIKWLYESKTFDLENCTYTPDFYLPDSNMYIEIKGWWRVDAKKKFKLFKSKYKDIKINVLNQEILKRMGVI